MPIRIGINGFGRIGRLVYRAAAQRGNFQIVGVNDLVPADNLAYLLQHDSSHGRFALPVKASGDGFTAGSQTTRTMSEKEPGKLPWKELGCDYVLESTGRFTEFDGAKQHLDGGARRVLISAPTKSDAEVPTLVYKVNHDKYDPARHTVSPAGVVALAANSYRATNITVYSKCAPARHDRNFVNRIGMR